MEPAPNDDTITDYMSVMPEYTIQQITEAHTNNNSSDIFQVIKANKVQADIKDQLIYNDIEDDNNKDAEK